MYIQEQKIEAKRSSRMYNKALSVITIAVVTVLSAQLSIPTADFFGIEDDASGYSGTCVLIPVNITNVQSGPIQTIIFNILYNNSVINVVAAHKGTLTSGWETIDYNNLDRGTRVSVGGFDYPILNGSKGSVVVLNVSIIGEPGETTWMNLSAIQLSDTDGSHVGTAPAKNATFTVLIQTPALVFDTGSGTYPSISGIHNGTLKPKQTINVSKLYTYPCEGTGGHTEYVRIWNNHILNATAKRDAGDWHNISFNKNFTLVAGETYYYTIRTGSYPQIIHNETFTDGYGTIISCDKFVDANGRVYYDWIPAIKLFGS